MAEESDLRSELEAARATITSQAMQIHHLQQDEPQTGAIHILRELLELSEVVGATVGQTPYKQLLNGIAEAARRLFDAGAASILLLDEATNELVFEAATGGGDVIGRRFPAHQGIAGWTVMSGEPIAVGDVRRDPRWAKDFAQSTGYVPKSILSVPMFLDEEAIGVVQVLDKASAASFGLDDMELLGLFARPAAIAVQQARMVTTMGKLLTQELERMANERGEKEVAAAAVTALADDAGAPDEMLELARLVHVLSRRSDRHRKLAFEILQSVSRLMS
jgi:transcriptional regulator with GAF, ATPase, and Fis domain